MKQCMKHILMLLAAAFVLTGCVDEDEYSNTPRDNFEALWRIIDERYCFFDYKASAYGLDWNEVHSRYARQITDDLTDTQLFEILGNMLGELRDGHVNMYSAWDISRNWHGRKTTRRTSATHSSRAISAPTTASPPD